MLRELAFVSVTVSLVADSFSPFGGVLEVAAAAGFFFGWYMIPLVAVLLFAAKAALVDFYFSSSFATFFLVYLDGTFSATSGFSFSTFGSLCYVVTGSGPANFLMNELRASTFGATCY